MRTLIMLFTICMLMSSCGSKKKYASLEEATEIKSITVSHGGGFAGRYTRYTVLENGQVFYSRGITDKFVETNSITKSQAKDIFEKYELLKIKDETINESANMTFEVECVDENGKSCKQRWVEDENQPKNLKLLYNYVISLVVPDGKMPKQDTSDNKIGGGIKADNIL